LLTEQAAIPKKPVIESLAGRSQLSKIHIFKRLPKFEAGQVWRMQRDGCLFD